MPIPEMDGCVPAIPSFHGMTHAFGFRTGTGQDYKEKIGTACPSAPVCSWEGRYKGVEAGQTWEELLQKNLKSFCPRYKVIGSIGVSVPTSNYLVSSTTLKLYVRTWCLIIVPIYNTQRAISHCLCLCNLGHSRDSVGEIFQPRVYRTAWETQRDPASAN